MFKIIEDSRQYFRTTMRPAQIQAHVSNIQFQQSHLGTIVSVLEQGMNYDCIMHNISKCWDSSGIGVRHGGGAASPGGVASYWSSGEGDDGHTPGGSGAQNLYQRDSGAGSFSGDGGRPTDNTVVDGPKRVRMALPAQRSYTGEGFTTSCTPSLRRCSGRTSSALDACTSKILEHW